MSFNEFYDFVSDAYRWNSPWQMAYSLALRADDVQQIEAEDNVFL